MDVSLSHTLEIAQKQKLLLATVYTYYKISKVTFDWNWKNVFEQSDYTANLGDLIPIAYNAFLYTLYLVNRLRFSIHSDLHNEVK